MKKNKEKLIEVLRMIDPAEASKAEAARTKKIIDLFEKNESEWENKLSAALTALSDQFAASLNKHNSAIKTHLTTVHDTLREHIEGTEKQYKEMGDTFAKYAERKPQDMSGFFKDMGVLLAEGNEHNKKTSELIRNLKWNSSMQLRDRSGSPLNPKTDGIGVGSYDYIALSQGSTTDTYTFYLGGATGQLVATIVITYTDSTKGTISTVVKTPVSV